MRGLAEIRKINEDPDAYHRAREPQHGFVQERRDEDQASHGERVEARQTERPDIQGMLADLGLSPTGRARSPSQKLDDLFFTALLLDIVAHAKATGEKEPAPMERVHSAIDAEPPFLRFWNRLNTRLGIEGRCEADYRTARAAFRGGETPVGAMTFIGKQWDGLRAVPSEPVAFLGGKRPAYHGEYRVVDDNGTRWHKVTDKHDQPIAFGIPEAAITAAEKERANGFHG